jgi:type IV pilus assembly protein PilW
VLWNFAVPVQAFQGSGTTTWSPTLPSDVPTAAIAGSAFTTNDVLVVRVPRRGATPTRLTADMSNGTSDITITDATPSPVAVNDVVMVSDCEGQAFLEVTGYSAAAGVGTIAHAVTAATTTSPGNLSDSTRYPFPADAEVTPMETHVYFMANSTAGTSTALWRKIGKNNAEELVEGVDGMRLLFGIDSSNDQQADSYVRASGVSNWNNVVSVRVALLVRSLEQYGNAVNTKTYELLDTTTTSFGDRRQRQIFSSTVTLRNRAL